LGTNRVAEQILPKFLTAIKIQNPTPRVLVIGGGAIGAGTDALYDDATIHLIGFDIYASQNTTFVADGHQIPLINESVDAVWIQAVLEHVLNPFQVVSEIYRVLKPNGLVFADSPFMQQVHEDGYDFMRFTVSGHRWLFRHFELIVAGISGGPGSAALWNIRYFFRALLGSDKIGTAIQMMFFWLRYFDRLRLGRRGMDAASAVFFYGRKSHKPIKPQDMIAFYDAQKYFV
jgi:SAM-dependent methyltransferase